MQTLLKHNTWGFFLLYAYYTAHFLAYPAPIRAQTVVFEENFDHSLEKWEVSRGNESFWNIENEALVGTVPTTFTIAELVPKDEFWDNTWRDFTLEMEYTPLFGADKNFSFFVQDPKNWYEFHFYAFGLELVAVKNDKKVWSRIYPAWLMYGINNAISLSIKDELISFSVQNTEIVRENHVVFAQGSGKIGLKLTTGSVAPTQSIIDSVKITVPNANTVPPPSPVPEPYTPLERLSLVSQHNPAWSTLEYNSASSWSDKTTIGDWGCVISSLTMIFQSHGIAQLPDGTELTPATLNNWLLQQPDGYIGGGLVNIPATTRITKAISDQLGTPKLEYSKHTALKEQVLQNQSNIGNPTMVEVPGHFLVSKKVIPNIDIFDVEILDPAFSYSKISEHKKEISSVSTFTPSFTDLSYIVISAEADFTLTDPKGNAISAQPHQITSALDSSNHSPIMHIIEVAKPENGPYKLSLADSNFTPLKIFAYSKDAEMTDLSLHSKLPDFPTDFLLTFSENGNSTIESIDAPVTSFNELITEFWNSKDIMVFFVYEQFSRVAKQYDQATDAQKQRYLAVILNTLSHYESFLTPHAKDKILEFVEQNH
ncbi:MAG: hypothetical protein WAU07_03105 [Microgenomates group bacterium]